MKVDTKLKPNGVLRFSLGFAGGYQSFAITGGPFDAFAPTANSYGVCVRAERVPATADVVLPIHDFQVPKVSDRGYVANVLQMALAAALEGRDVYVGCMGGWGRTGLFLALLAKAAGETDPIGFVRKNYTPRAVETSTQEKYVKDFDVGPIRGWLFWAGWRKFWSFGLL